MFVVLIKPENRHTLSQADSRKQTHTLFSLTVYHVCYALVYLLHGNLS